MREAAAVVGGVSLPASLLASSLLEEAASSPARGRLDEELLFEADSSPASSPAEPTSLPESDPLLFSSSSEELLVDDSASYFSLILKGVSIAGVLCYSGALSGPLPYDRHSLYPARSSDASNFDPAVSGGSVSFSVLFYLLTSGNSTVGAWALAPLVYCNSEPHLPTHGPG